MQRMRRGWAGRFSASCTVVPFPARAFEIGGATVDEVMCFTPQLSKIAPAITFTTYRDGVCVIVRYPAEMTDAPARLQAVLDG
jgi:WS/DGAT C-terminal domain